MDDILIQKSSAGYNLADYLSKEWLETNQLGGYASSSILNCHTRKYHGLLVSQLEHLPGKLVLLSQLEENFSINNKNFLLSTFRYRNQFVIDKGFQYFTEFKQSIFPECIYQCEQYQISRKIMMPTKENCVLVCYETNASKEDTVSIRIRPLFAMRNFHCIQSASSNLQAEIEFIEDGAVAKFHKWPSIFLQSTGLCQFVCEPTWYYQFEYFCEQERGYDAIEDLYSPGYFIISKVRETIIFSASLIRKNNLEDSWRQELLRRENLVNQLTGDPLQQRLQFVAPSFLRQVSMPCDNGIENIENNYSKNQQNKWLSVVAGYHWFEDWGRDAMISLPGLTLINGYYQECLAVLRYFASKINQGLIPNFIGIKPEYHSYHTADASLWFAWVVQEFWHVTHELNIIKEDLWPALCQIFTGYCQGTHYNIHLKENGLIWSGNPEDNISWMDAVVDGVPITSRFGYKVEINALWYNLLGFMKELCIEFARSSIGGIQQANADQYQEKIVRSKEAFIKTFCYTEKGYLYDYVNEQECNKDIRPNQIFAASLPYTPLTAEQAKQILNVVTKYLYTPYGLRTLASLQKNYQGICFGDQATRDRAYHQGTVWPWLLGHYTSALLRFYDISYVNQILVKSKEAFTQHLSEQGIGTIAEIFDGDSPQYPRGCISQAWSVAEVLRMLKLLG